jgi:signal transduction histidine kinase
MESKLLLSFMGILAMAVGMACFLILQDHSQTVDAMSVDHALCLSQFLAAASRPALQQDHREELASLGRSLASQGDVVAVGFFDATGILINSAGSERVVREISNLTPSQAGKTGILQPAQGVLPGVGHFVSVAAAVMARRPGEGPDDGMHVVGYVMLWLSRSAAETEMANATLKMILVGTLTVLCCFPVAAVLTHNFFEPIRQLVAATKRTIAGDLGTQVAVHRPDVIGVLARSFNEMVEQIRLQQDALATANRELESAVQQRTGQLEAANKRLSSEIAEKEDFLRAVSHDLNAPLRNISGMATMLLHKHQDLDADVIQRLERIQKNVEVETALIGELMELSRIKTQRQPMEIVDTRALVEKVAGLFEADLRYRNIRFCIDGPMPTLKCEPTRLGQVFQNLIDNAIKYMGDRPDVMHEIRVGCAVRAGEAEFSVRDTGVGIAAEDIPKLFHAFRRGGSARAAKVAGKGIGLASVKSIVETYSGTIWVESLLGSGATFRFTINGQYVVDPAAARAA